MVFVTLSLNIVVFLKFNSHSVKSALYQGHIHIQEYREQWRIQDSPEGAPTPKVGVLIYYFA